MLFGIFAGLLTGVIWLVVMAFWVALFGIGLALVMFTISEFFKLLTD